jgi:16S rRNA (cytosine967-C5)-methyltransferase
MNEYSSMQRKIVSHVWPSLKQGGYFLYITCSFFKKENEEQVKFICDQWNANLVRMEIFRGYEDKADTLFAALLQKPL